MNQHSLSRREALKTLVAAVGAISLSTLPERWIAPVIETGVLPAHAATSDNAEVFYGVELIRQLTPCENHGMHHIFIQVQDRNGQGVNGVPVIICWGPPPYDCVLALTKTKSDLNGNLQAGRIDFAMFKGSYEITVYDLENDKGVSEVAGPVSPDNGQTEACGEDQTANSPYHISFEVIFRQV